MRKVLPWMCINGKITLSKTAVIPVLDEGFMYGYSFFTTIKVRQSIPLFFEKHIQRLQMSAKELFFPKTEIIFDTDKNSVRNCNFLWSLRQSLQEIIERNEIIDGAIRITITRGLADTPTIVIYATEIDKDIHTVSVITVLDTRDVFKTIKMTYRVPHMLAMRQAQTQGAQDALFTQDGFIIESTYANIYSQNKNIFTPSITKRALDSISRKILFQQLPIQEQEISENTEDPMVLVSSLSIRVVE